MTDIISDTRDVAIKLSEMDDPLAFEALTEIMKLRHEIAFIRASQRLTIDAVASVLAEA